MTITITPQNGDNVVGPGIQLFLSSTFIGPLPTGSHWNLDLTPTARPGELTLRSQHTNNLNPVFIKIWDAFDQLVSQVSAPPGGSVVDGTSIDVAATLSDPSFTPLDTGTITLSWSNTVGLAQMLGSYFVFPPTSGGSTALLTQILAAVQQTYQNSP